MSSKTTQIMSSDPLSPALPTASVGGNTDTLSLSVPFAPSPQPIAPAARRRSGVGEATVSLETRSLRHADALAAGGEIDKALAHLRKMIASFPQSTRACIRIAALLREKRQPKDALEFLRRAAVLSPSLPAIRETIAELCLEMGRGDEAMTECHILLRIAPNSLLARDVLSAVYLQRGLLDHALRVTDEMIFLDPTDAANHFKRGVLLQQKGLIGGAVRAFSRVMDMAPDSEAAEESRAALEMLDNYQIRQIITLAVEDIPFRLSLRHNPARAVTEKGYLLSEMGLNALSQMAFDNLPEAPPGWRHFFYQ